MSEFANARRKSRELRQLSGASAPDSAKRPRRADVALGNATPDMAGRSATLLERIRTEPIVAFGSLPDEPVVQDKTDQRNKRDRGPPVRPVEVVQTPNRDGEDGFGAGRLLNARRIQHLGTLPGRRNSRQNRCIFICRMECAPAVGQLGASISPHPGPSARRFHDQETLKTRHCEEARGG